MKYMIPKNVKTRFEFMEGFGWKELFITLLGALIGVCLFFILLIFKFPVIIRLPLAIFPIGIAFFISKRDSRTNKSVIDLLKEFRDFSRKQRVYFYHFGTGRGVDDSKAKG